MIGDICAKESENRPIAENKGDQKTEIVGNAAAKKIDNKENKNRDLETKEWIKKGTKAFNARDFDAAITCYKEAIAKSPNSVDAHYNLGLTYANKGMMDEAISAYKKTTTISPKHAKAYNNLGIAYEQKKMADESFLMYQKAVDLNPDLAPAQYNLGRSYFSRKDKNPQYKSLAAYHLHKAGLLFIKGNKKNWAANAYTYLKMTEAKELEEDLHKKLYPQEKPKEKKSIKE
jgi:Flp pilus assembly protein TadD